MRTDTRCCSVCKRKSRPREGNPCYPSASLASSPRICREDVCARVPARRLRRDVDFGGLRSHRCAAECVPREDRSGPRILRTAPYRTVPSLSVRAGPCPVSVTIGPHYIGTDQSPHVRTSVDNLAESAEYPDPRERPRTRPCPARMEIRARKPSKRSRLITGIALTAAPLTLRFSRLSSVGRIPLVRDTPDAH